eukprot:TRINITY_DN1341_c0_g1_i9.p2 TRINITY_DN1341_c0_g1~~TRINITY_DN1341_c0_g1_i9.p2  ORF type:complete len:128 (-),score=13.38 TRINITY_DN1341_c0_g1_i9:11-394(-)
MQKISGMLKEHQDLEALIIFSVHAVAFTVLLYVIYLALDVSDAVQAKSTGPNQFFQEMFHKQIKQFQWRLYQMEVEKDSICLLYTSDAADEEDSVDLGGRRIRKKKKTRAREQNDPGVMMNEITPDM